MGKFLESYKKYVEHIQNKKIVIWGAGYRCVEILQTYFRYPYDDIFCICDSDSGKWGNKLYDIEICNPNCLIKNPNDYVVIIAIYNDFELKRIEERLKNMNVEFYSSAILMLSNQIERYDAEGNKKYHELNTYKEICEHENEISKVEMLLEDEYSKSIYRSFVDKIKYNIKDYSDIADDLYEHYFTDDIFRYSDNEIIVDGGAFDGDDTVCFSKMLDNYNLSLRKSLCFEPDTLNFVKTMKNLEKHFGCHSELDSNRQTARSEKFVIFKAGLFDKKCGVGICEYGAHSSRLTNDNKGVCVDAVKLDDVCKDENVTFIKYDLEGADVPALMGAEETIKKCKPKLALSIYHNISDLWEIPLLVKKMVPEYKLYVRHHTIYLWDKILYAGIEKDIKKNG